MLSLQHSEARSIQYVGRIQAYDKGVIYNKGIWGIVSLLGHS